MLNKDIIYQIKNIVEENNTKYTPLIYISGSSTIPFINNPHDIDVVAYLSNGLSINNIWEYEWILRSALQNNIGKKVSVIYYKLDDYYTIFDIRTSKECDKDHVRKYGNVISNMFMQKYIIPIKDDLGYLNSGYSPFDIIHSDPINFLNMSKIYLNSTEFKSLLKRYGRAKILYKILCGIYFIENGSFDLTDEQKRNINIVHDRLNGYEELYQWCLRELSKLL